MQHIQAIINNLTSRFTNGEQEIHSLLGEFARSFGWQPSFEIENIRMKEIVNAHLMIEHGLENAAVLTFMKDRPFSNLNFFEKKALLEISYNNLVDWHIFISNEEISYVNNRVYPSVSHEEKILGNKIDQLRYEEFLKLIEILPSANIKKLDETLIEQISYWRRLISSELNNSVSNVHLSEFFNALIIIRAAEDYRKKDQFSMMSNFVLIEKWNNLVNSKETSVRELIFSSLRELTSSNFPYDSINLDLLVVFDKLPRSLIGSVVKDFYGNKYFDYDFSIISKHALSKIYEKYVSILRVRDTNQDSFFPTVPEELSEKIYGEVYTPQYIATFFAKVLEKEMGEEAFVNAKTIDPACGSGIFLRTIAEFKIETFSKEKKKLPDHREAERIFQNIYGLDIDPNARKAAQLSLSLLNLVVEGQIKNSSNIFQEESLSFFENSMEYINTFDIVVANPPFINYDRMQGSFREQVIKTLGELKTGRVDSYLAFLVLSINLLKPGGYAAIVIPQSFLIAGNAKKIREYLHNLCDIKYLIDLSSISVFEETGAYVILLIFQKKKPGLELNPEATLVRCRDMPGKALQETLEVTEVDTISYSIYRTKQKTFGEETWSISSKRQTVIREYLEAEFDKLEDFLEVREGFITGDDEIFIVPKKDIPKGEDAVFRPVIKDRDISIFINYNDVEHFVFYPYENDRKLTEDDMISRYPATWSYLQKHKRRLENRKSVSGNSNVWWQPIRPRQPKHILKPKIITPHLMLLPRFSLDLSGGLLVSHSPYLTSVETGLFADQNNENLKFFAAILNSPVCHWYMSVTSQRYSKGYLLLESKSLRKIPVPNPSSINPLIFRRIVDNVERIINSKKSNINLTDTINKDIFSIYKLNSDELLS